jgi:predicted Fe-Mo cluster-binding NifX family protein
MKIAAITEDGNLISQHFGRAPYYMVVTVEENIIVERELRQKIGHSHFVDLHIDGEPAHGQGHGMDAALHDKHTQMAASISDCQALLCRGMGMGAYNSMQQLGIRPVVTDIAFIDEAVMAYINDKIVDRTDKLH